MRVWTWIPRSIAIRGDLQSWWWLMRPANPPLAARACRVIQCTSTRTAMKMTSHTSTRYEQVRNWLIAESDVEEEPPQQLSAAGQQAAGSASNVVQTAGVRTLKGDLTGVAVAQLKASLGSSHSDSHLNRLRRKRRGQAQTQRASRQPRMRWMRCTRPEAQHPASKAQGLVRAGQHLPWAAKPKAQSRRA